MPRWGSAVIILWTYFSGQLGWPEISELPNRTTILGAAKLTGKSSKGLSVGLLNWEYNLGSTFYLVWAHVRSAWEGAYNPSSEIVGDLFGMKGNNIFMFKLSFWFSL